MGRISRSSRWFLRPILPAASLLLVACHTGPSVPDLPRRVDLLAQSAWAEVRAGAVDLDWLLSRPLLFHEGLERTTSTTPQQGQAPWAMRRVPRATLDVRLSDARDRELRFVARSYTAGAVRVVVLWNGRPFETVSLSSVESEHRLNIPASLQRAGGNLLAFESLEIDGRRDVFRVFSLEIAEPKASRPLAVPAFTSDGFWLPAGSSLAFMLREEPPATLRLAARAPGGASHLTVSLGEGQKVFEIALGPGGSREVERAVPLRPGHFERLELASDGPEAVLVSAVELRTRERVQPPPAALSGRPNIVVVVNDALRADYLGVYGHAGGTSPRLDAFAREAVIFEEALAQASWTRPAVATILTGLTPEAHGVDGVHDTLSRAVPTLAEVLKRAGYGTSAFVANDILSPRFGYWRGFDVRHIKRVSARQLVDAALAWLDTAPRPFLAYVHTIETHRPYEPAPEHWRPFLPPGAQPTDLRSAARRCPDVTAEEMAMLLSAYLGEVHQNDAAFGALLDGLSARHLLDNTIVVFTADHGEAFGEHGSCGHSLTLYQEALRVPLLLRLPGVRGRREPSVAQQADLMPTLLALAGVRAPEPVEGRDISGLLLRRTPLAPSGVPLVSHLTYATADKAAARLGRFKLVFNREREPSGPRLELFDLAADPGELHNIAEREPIATQYLLAQLVSLRQAERILKERRRTGEEVDLTAAEKEALRALGYVQ